MSIRSFAKKILPRRTYKAAAIPRDGVPPDVIPSMITRNEAEFFSECARGLLPLGGTTVDLGCFMGSTAIALARGVIESGRREEIVAYDLFTWEEWKHDHSRLHGVYLSGDSFLPMARRYARDHGYLRLAGMSTTCRHRHAVYSWLDPLPGLSPRLRREFTMLFKQRATKCWPSWTWPTSLRP
jgi:hypothetical protein